MKIEIYAKPTFKVYLTKTLVESLLECCDTHYSPECIKAGKPGGSIYYWSVNVQLSESMEDVEPAAMAEFRDLDIALKIMEHPPTMPTDRLRELQAFAQLIHKALTDGQREVGRFRWTVTSPSLGN